MAKKVISIGNVQLNSDDIVNYLKFINEFDEIANKIVNDHLTIEAAKQRNISLSQDELQHAVDDFRRFAGLHRAKETQEWMEALNVTPDDFESFVSGLMLKNKMIVDITSDEEVDKYFRLHSPEFEAVDIKHIVVTGEDKAKEILALLDDDPDMFDELVAEHTVDEDTQYTNGQMTNVRRGTLETELEAKIFNAKAGDIVGPMQLGDEGFFEIVLVLDFHPAELTDNIRDEVSKSIYKQWLAERAKDVTITIS